MAGHDGLVMDLNDVGAVPPDARGTPKTNMEKGQKAQDSDTGGEERRESPEEEEEEEEMSRSAHLEPTTLPWPGDRDKKLLLDQEEERSQDLEEGDERSRGRWRDDKGDGSLADDEEDEEEEWMSEKPSTGFTPLVTIVRPTTKELPEESRYPREEQQELQMEHPPAAAAAQFYSEWEEPDEKYYSCEDVCGERLRLVLATVAAALLFPLLVWAGYALLPFDPPQLDGAPLRVLYTLRCSFFAIIPIVLGVVVQGLARLRFSALKPLYRGRLVDQEVMVHWHYVNESLSLFLFYFLQLAVMATYISQDLVKLVPLLTIIFVFGRLIYWLCLSLDSAIRGFGFGFSFFPILVMLGANLYYVCTSLGQDSVFDVAPPTTPPPPRLRWWF